LLSGTVIRKLNALVNTWEMNKGVEKMSYLLCTGCSKMTTSLFLQELPETQFSILLVIMKHLATGKIEMESVKA
jgi:hypothetical protein